MVRLRNHDSGFNRHATHSLQQDAHYKVPGDLSRYLWSVSPTFSILRLASLYPLRLRTHATPARCTPVTFQVYE